MVVDTMIDHTKNVMNSMYLPKDNRKDLVGSITDLKSDAV